MTVVSRPDGLADAARLIRQGGLVAFPTETVYGLGADASNPEAVASIFQAKGRPSDNPLIVHIADAGMWPTFARGIDNRALSLAERFWPGPLTIVLPRTGATPGIVTAGLDTVGVRMPAHPLALSLIRESCRALAAPSANRSGRPSPTTAQAVLDDMDGVIPMILDGGPCPVGVESTVLDMSRTPPVVLRPGGVTVEALRELLPDAAIDPSALSPPVDGRKAASPGIAHRHYAPNIPLTVVIGSRYSSKLPQLYDDTLSSGGTPILLLSDESSEAFAPRRCIPLGPYNDPARISSRLFNALRELDNSGATVAFAESFPAEGAGLALMNRLLRAAGFSVIHSD
ncbi:MAG: threonylcarbamoyl-AMP synthase [Oscillospiraceae bacterium]|jgi:L-threonylcarbamoyladenylate synthase|nr:threonylcarbamoyl-AMP synthase [Oscillospiraceae bacterium]